MASNEPAGVYEETVVHQGVTTSAGNVGGTTLVDTGLTQGTDYWKNMVVLILSGDSNKQSRRISGFAAATGTITVDTAFASQIASGTRFAILSQHTGDGVGDATATNQALILADTNAILIDTAALANDIYARTNNKTLNAILGIPDRVGSTALRFMLDTIFHDNFDDNSLSTTLWGSAVVTGSTTVTESASAPNTLRIYNPGGTGAGTGYLPTIAQFSNNLSIRSKIEIYQGALASTGERCQAYILLYTSANDYIYFGAYRDTSEAVNARGRVIYNINGGGATSVTVDSTILDNIAREYRIDVTAENIMFYIDDVLVYTLKDLTLINYYIQLYGGTQNIADIIDIRFDYCKVNRLSDDFRQIYKKLLQIQGGSDSIGTVINKLDSTLDLNAITGSITADGTVQTVYENTNTSAFLFRNVDIDLVNMQAGDTVVITKSKKIDGTNYRQISSTTYNNVQTNTGITITGNEGARSGIKVTLQQTAGINRVYSYTYYDEVGT